MWLRRTAMKRFFMFQHSRSDFLLGFAFTCNVVLVYHVFSIATVTSVGPEGSMESIIPTEQPAKTSLLQPQSTTSLKRILIYDTTWGLRMQDGQEDFNDCSHKKVCEIVRNVKGLDVTHFDAVVFHRPTLPLHPPNLARVPRQRYIFFSMEPAVHMPTLKFYENYFNWTMSFRSDSDFRLHFGKLERIEDHAETMKIDYLKNKTKTAAWFVSNCKTTGSREKYVQKLRKYVQVDIYGRCGNSTIPPRSDRKEVEHQTYVKSASEYLFYLSFENSICEDYISEKLYNIMQYDIIPVVYGGGNYSALLPKYSYINANDYTPRKLATYLNHLRKHPDEYNAYFWWKKYYKVHTLEDTNRSAFCDVCESLHTNSTHVTKVGIGAWWFHEKKCKWNYKFRDDR